MKVVVASKKAILSFATVARYWKRRYCSCSGSYMLSLLSMMIVSSALAFIQY
jgi:hypothetical protein